MSSLGSFLLLASFVVSAYAVAASVAGARQRFAPPRRERPGSLLPHRGADDRGLGDHRARLRHRRLSHQVRQHYSDAVQPLFYKITLYWGGLDGSIMFWVFLLAVFGAVAVYVNRERHRELIPYVVAIISVVQMFFLFMMIAHKNPFDTFLIETPADGRGLNPLLQNLYMAIHPPSLYIGFVGMTIPYAFGMAALITGHLDDSWLRAVRRWTMVSWLFLSFGLTLGMIWAYEELGWGGYWGWDPVENAGLLPWFTATAFLHSVIVQERRGMLRVWNVTLVIVTFFLTIFGTFMTRSGVVQSVHAFGEDRALAFMFTVFMGAILPFSFALADLPAAAAQGAPRVRFVALARSGVPGQQLDPAVRRALRPLRHDVPDDQRGDQRRAADGGPAVLQPVDAADRPGAAVPDRRRAAARLAQVHAGQPPRSVPVAGGWSWSLSRWPLPALGPPRVGLGLCFALSAFVFATIVQEFWRGARVRRAGTGTDLLTAMVGLVARSSAATAATSSTSASC